MSLENFKNRKIEWDTVNKNFDQSVQVISGDVNSRTLTIVVTDNGEPIDLTGYSVKLVYKYIYRDSSGFVMLTPIDAQNGEFSLTIPTEMTVPGSIKSNLILLNESLEQVIVSKNLKFISDDSTVTDLAQEVNNKIDDFTKLLLENMPQVMRSELNDLHAQTESNTSNIDLKANLADMTSLQSAMTDLKNEVEAFGISPENLVTIKSLLDAIANSATDSELAELINSVNILTSNIALMSNNGDYSPKANQTDLESLQSAVNNQAATISTKANKTDLDSLQTTVNNQGVAISKKAEQSDLLITNQNVTTAQTTANQAETDAQTAISKATQAQANSLPVNGNAVSASKLATARKLQVSLQSSTYQKFDGTSDATNLGVTGVLPIANGGTGTNYGVINTIAYANSADGTDSFTTVYPNLNLLSDTTFKNYTPKTQQYLSMTINDDGGVNNKSYVNVSYNNPTSNSWANIISWTFPKEYFKPSTTYTFSFYLRGTGTIRTHIHPSLIDTSSVNGLADGNAIIPASDGLYDWQLTSNWVRHTYTFVTKSIITSDQIFLFRIYDTGNNADICLPKAEPGSTATPWMPSSSEVTTADYPKYVGFSNIIKPNKTYSDYKWLPMGLVSIDSATGLLKPAVIGVDYAQARPIGSVVTNSSSSSSGYSTGTWSNIGSAVIGSTTIYYWKRTA